MASLPVLNGADDTQLVRLYHRAVTLWSSHVADEAAFGPAAVYANARMRSVPEANCIIGELRADEVGRIQQYFADASTAPLQWLLPAGDGQIAGLCARSHQLWRLASASPGLPLTHRDLTIIPARASFPHVQQIAALMHPRVTPADAAEAAMSHLDDAHVDAVLALRAGGPAGYASIISTGEVGFIMELFVPEALRRRGYGLALAGQILDVAARALFKQVCCITDARCVPAGALLERIGFRHEATMDYHSVESA